MPTDLYNDATLRTWLDSLPEDRVLVLVTGVFDMLHEEHRTFLRKAKEAGEYLLVCIESDSRVKQLKGENRPFWDQDRRLEALRTIKEVDFVCVLPEQFDTVEDRERFISFVRPSILAVSSHSPHLDKKKMLVEKYGGELKIVHEHNPEVSTTLIAEREQ